MRSIDWLKMRPRTRGRPFTSYKEGGPYKDRPYKDQKIPYVPYKNHFFKHKNGPYTAPCMLTDDLNYYHFFTISCTEIFSFYFSLCIALSVYDLEPSNLLHHNYSVNFDSVKKAQNEPYFFHYFFFNPVLQFLTFVKDH